MRILGMRAGRDGPAPRENGPRAPREGPAPQERSEKARERRARNDRLMGNADFQDLLRQVADMGGLLDGERREDSEWMAGYRAALRDHVRAVAMNSTGGPDWLAEYARRRLERADARRREAER